MSFDGPDRRRDEEPIGTLIARAVDEARDLAKAELTLAKAKVGERVAAYRSAMVFFVIAAVLAFAAFIALLVGAIFTLATLIGPGLATLAVVVLVFAIAGILGLIGKGRLKPVVVDTPS